MSVVLLLLLESFEFVIVYIILSIDIIFVIYSKSDMQSFGTKAK